MPEAVVVGAGPGGLAASAMLRRAGVETVVVDRAGSVGASWRGHYDRLHLHTVRWLSHLPGFPIPRRFGRWVSRDHVVGYLEAYAQFHEVDVRLRTEITRVDRAGDRWVLRSPAGDIEATYVVVATGHNHTPAMPAWPGIDEFRGELLHASRYRNATPYVGKSVLVVGSGNTGAEIAVDLVEGGAREVAIASARRRTSCCVSSTACRRSPWACCSGTSRRGCSTRSPRPCAPCPWATCRGTVLPAPSDGLYERVLRDDAIPLVDVGLLAALKSGQVHVVAAVAGFEGSDVLPANGSRVQPDVVIAATGYRRGLEPLVGHLGVLADDGRPLVRGGDTHPAAARLWFTGFTNPISGMFRELGIDARRVARAVVRDRARSGDGSVSALLDTMRVTAPRVVPRKEHVRG